MEYGPPGPYSMGVHIRSHTGTQGLLESIKFKAVVDPGVEGLTPPQTLLTPTPPRPSRIRPWKGHRKCSLLCYIQKVAFTVSCLTVDGVVVHNVCLVRKKPAKKSIIKYLPRLTSTNCILVTVCPLAMEFNFIATYSIYYSCTTCLY